MSHVVEQDPERVFRDAQFGLRVSRGHWDGHFYTNTKTAQCTLREHRCIAIQYIMSCHLGYPISVKRWAALWNFHPDWLQAKVHLAQLHMQEEEEGWSVEDSVMTAWCVESILASVDVYEGKGGIEWVWSEWRRKCVLHDDLVSRGQMPGPFPIT